MVINLQRCIMTKIIYISYVISQFYILKAPNQFQFRIDIFIVLRILDII